MVRPDAFRPFDRSRPDRSKPDRPEPDTEIGAPGERPSAREARLGVRPDLCPSVEQATAEAAGYLDWVCCRQGCGCGD